AEKYAEHDRKRTELAEPRDQRDSLIYAVDRTVGDLGDKVSPQERDNIEKAKQRLQSVVNGNDAQAIKDGLEALSKALHDVTIRAYQAAGQSGYQAGQTSFGGTTPGANGKADGTTVEGEYTVKNDEERRGV